MAESLSVATKKMLARSGLLLLAGIASTIAQAQQVPDPTRPATITANGGANAAGSAGPVLQSVLISPGRRLAIISGQTVQVGDSIGDRRVVRISDGEVILNDGKELQTLKLYPGIEKRRTTSSSTAKSNGRRP